MDDHHNEKWPEHGEGRDMNRRCEHNQDVHEYAIDDAAPGRFRRRTPTQRCRQERCRQEHDDSVGSQFRTKKQGIAF
jgi:hypothetical protein